MNKITRTSYTCSHVSLYLCGLSHSQKCACSMVAILSWGPSLLSLPRTQPLPAPPTGLLYTHAEWSPRADSLAPHSSAHRFPAIPLSPCYTICPGSRLG